MKKFFLSNTNFTIKDLTSKKVIKSELPKKKTVDINVLLNRVKIDKQKEMKKKIIFTCGCLSALVLLSILITIFK